MQRIFKYSLLSLMVMSASTLAEEGFRQHDAHVHGHVELHIAQDSNELWVEITAPGADVVGFEHAPKNKQQHEILEKAKETLQQTDKILLLSANAGCKAKYIGVIETLEEKHEEHEHEGHDHAKHDEHAHEGQDHAKHDEHAHEGHDHAKHDEHAHEGHDHKEGGHGEFKIEYHFECSDIAKLKSIDTTWFTHFPNTKEIDANVLTDKAQIAVELDKNNHRIKL